MGKTTKTAVDYEVIDELCDWLADGRMITDFCRIPGHPREDAIDTWRKVDEEVDRRVARAHARGHQRLHEQILNIADQTLEGVEVTEELEVLRDADGEVMRDENDEPRLVAVNRKVKRSDNLGRSKLMIEARQKYLAVIDPNRYAERRQVEVDGKLSLAELVVGVAEEMEAHGGETSDSGSEDLFG